MILISLEQNFFFFSISRSVLICEQYHVHVCIYIYIYIYIYSQFPSSYPYFYTRFGIPIFFFYPSLFHLTSLSSLFLLFTHFFFVFLFLQFCLYFVSEAFTPTFILQVTPRRLPITLSTLDLLLSKPCRLLTNFTLTQSSMSEVLTPFQFTNSRSK